MSTEITYFTIDIPTLIANSIAPVAAAAVIGIGVGLLGWAAIAAWSKILSIQARRAEKAEQ